MRALLVCAGVPLGDGLHRPLSEPIEAWHFDLRCPPEESGRQTLDVEFTTDGIFNAVVFWFTLHLINGITISSPPGAATSAPGQLLCSCILMGFDPSDTVCILHSADEPCLMLHRNGF